MNSNNLTIRDIVDFVKQKPTKFLNGLSDEDIAQIFIEAFGKKAASYCVAPETGEIVGVVICSRNDECKILHINYVFTKARWALKALVDKFIELYNDYTITAYRRERFVKYDNTKRLCSKILSLQKA